MPDFGLNVTITDKATGKPIAGATASGTVCGLDASDAPIDAMSGPDGVASIKGIYLTVTAPDYEPYMAQLYRRPALGAPVPVSLRRSTP